MGWKWNEEFVKCYAVHLREKGYSPWWTADQCATFFKYLEEYGKEEKCENTQSS